MSDLTDNQVRALLKKAGSGPWDVDGPVWNRTVWRSSENRVCFMAHSNGLDDDRDIATSELVAAAPDLARALLQARADAAAAQTLMVAELRQFVTDSYQCGCMDAGCAGRHEERNSTLEALSETLDALAPDAGTAELAKLRGERDDLAHVLDAREASYGISSNGNMWRFWSEKALESAARNKALTAERDTLAAANAVLEAKVAGLVEAAEDAEYDLLQWLECSKALTAAGFNMDGTAEVTAKLTSALSHIKRGKTNG